MKDLVEIHLCSDPNPRTCRTELHSASADVMIMMDGPWLSQNV
jgi:hypothetical protein